jgi:hypothetical protein
MKKQVIVGLFLMTVFLAGAPVFAQNCEDLKKLIDKTYNFKPSKLTEAERNTKSAEMDLVWNKVKANSKELLPCLREAIDSRTNDGFFRFDASNLLIKLDQSDDAKKRLIKSYAAVDLTDVNLAYWVPPIATLGYEGFDTTAAGENWLRNANPSNYSPGVRPANVRPEYKINGAVIIYGSMDESTATPALLKIAATENHPGREIAVEVLLKQATAQSFKELGKLNQKGLSEAIRKKINDKPKFVVLREGTPKTSRQEYLDAFQQFAGGKTQAFMQIAYTIPDGDSDVVVVMKKEDIPLIRKVRRAFAASGNPQAEEWYQSFTDILWTLVWKFELANTGTK